MPILCPKSSLWKFGKHARRGGRRSKAIKSSAASRKVNTKGTLAHPFVTKQVDLGRCMMTMSPGSTGGVYMGPVKEEKEPALASQEKKLAQIRSPTHYYTDKSAIIDQDDVPTKAKEEDDKHGTRPVHSQQKLAAIPIESRYNDTLNPDGTNASIVFFEETFMSKFSHLSTSSPQCAAPRNIVSRSPKTTKIATRTQVTQHSACAPLSPSKRTREYMESDHEDDAEACTESAALLTPSKQPPSSTHGGHRSRRNVIPSWVRQRRYLPTIDDVDFDQIDVISLHSLTPNESRISVTSPTKGSEQRTDSSPSRDTRSKMHGTYMPLNNRTTPKNVRDKPQAIQTNKEPSLKKLEHRPVLGDLTNTPGSPVKGRTKSDSTSMSYKMPKRSSAGERRSRRNRLSGSRKPRSASREHLISALDRVSQHNYVNLEYIANLITDSPPRETDTNEDDSDHDYVNVRSRSPAKAAKVTGSPLRLENDALKDAQKELCLENDALKGAQKESPVKQVLFKDGPHKSKQSVQSRRRRSEQIHRPQTKPATCPEDPDLENLDEFFPWTGERCKPASSNRRSFPVAGPSLTVKEVNLNESQARKNLFGVPSQRVDGGATVLSTAANGADNVATTRRNATPPNMATGHDGKSDKSAYTSLSENDSLLVADGSAPSRQTNHVHARQETKRLIEKPSYTDNTLRKARIVRTNSIEESQSTLARKSQKDREVRERQGMLDRKNQKDRETKERQITLDRQNQKDRETKERQSTLDPKNQKDRDTRERQSVLERRNHRAREERMILKSKDEDKARVFTPRKSSHVETRRSLPAPASVKEVSSAQMTPQRRSTTNVRTVEAKLSKKQNRKIRRTVEGDEVLEAIARKAVAKPSAGGTITSTDPGDLMHESQGRGRVVLEDSPEKDEATRVQKIINDWNQSSKRIVSAHRSTHYVGTHVHAVPDPHARKDGRTRAQNFMGHKEPTAKPPGVKWKKSDRANRENSGRDRPTQPTETLRNDITAQSVEVSHSAIRRIPTVASSANVTTNRRSVPPSVIEIYIASQPYSPAEVDEIEVQQGEILVVNSSMQRETDWMWIYAPRSDRFGYIPAFAARPLEFQQSEV